MEEEPEADEVAVPVLELEPEPDVVDEPERLPLVVEPVDVPLLLLLLPLDTVPLVLESEPLLTVPLVAPEPDVVPVEGEATGTRVELAATGAEGMKVGVPAGLVATAG